MRYIDLVVCKHDKCDTPYTFQAPAFSGLKKGDVVIVDTIRGEQFAQVEISVTIDADDDVYRFIMSLLGVKGFKKVIKRIIPIELDYKEDSDGTY